MRIPTLVLSVLLLLSAGLYAGERIGEVTYVEGKVDLTRNGRQLAGEPDFGTQVENYDLFAAGDDGFAEVFLDSSTGADGRVTISRNSSFYFEISRLGQKRKAGIQLLAGAVSFSVKKLAGTSEFEVRTDNAVMAVRGTEFTVMTAPGGELLVTCRSGKVELRDESGSGSILFAEPGFAVEQVPGEVFRNIPVAVSDLETFREEWLTERIEVFRGAAAKMIERYAKRYDELTEQFNTSYGKLIEEWGVLSKWINEDRAGTVGGTIDLMREKKALVAPLLNVRKPLFILERVYFRLLELKGYYEQGYGSSADSAAFFRRLEADGPRLASRMSLIRYVLKLYSLRNDGTVPGYDTGFSSGSTDMDFPSSAEDDFFGDSGDFF